MKYKILRKQKIKSFIVSEKQNFNSYQDYLNYLEIETLKTEILRLRIINGAC